jgi:hypothetical protein
MTLEDVIAQERAGLLSEYLYPEAASGASTINVPPYAAVPNFDILTQTPRSLRSRHPVRVVEVSAAQRGQSFAEVCPTLNYKSFWTYVDNENYRADYISFLQEYHGMSILALPDTHHVDHLCNRERARLRRLPYVRLILLPHSIQSRAEGMAGAEGGQPGIDEILLLKLWGISSFRRGLPFNAEMQAQVVRMAALFGLPAADVERRVHELMESASSRAEP